MNANTVASLRKLRIWFRGWNWSFFFIRALLAQLLKIMFSKVSVCGSDVSQIEQKSALGFGVLLFVDLSFRVKGESEIEKA